MKFRYNKQINKRYWRSNLKYKEMFGIKFPDKISITKEDEIKAKEKASKSYVLWNNKDKELKEGIFKIYKYELPKNFECYIVTTKTSAINLKKKYILLSMYVPANRIPVVIIHEFSHIAFLIKWGDFCKKLGYADNGIQELKEVLTVINNFVFKNIVDKGYEAHKDIRRMVKEMWLKGCSLKEIISDPKIINLVNSLNTIKER